MEAVKEKVQLQKYPAYKDSEIEWVGKVPDHWTVKKLKHLFVEKKKTSNPGLNCGSISFGKVVYKDDEKVTEATKSSYQEVLEGDFLINPLNLNYDLISLRIALSQINVVVSSGYIVLQNKIELDKDYFNYLLHIFDVSFMKTLGSGVRQTLSFNHLANSELLYPPKQEQTAIASFLDEKCDKIDSAIAQKQQLIALLKERKQIIIQELVTGKKVWNASKNAWTEPVEVKDSGVEWIGEIPEHWEVKELRYISNSYPSNVDKHSKKNETPVLLCNYTDVYKNEFITMEFDFMKATATDDQIQRFKLLKGDIIITKDSETADDIAAPALVKEDLQNVICGYHLAMIRPNKEIFSEFLFRQLQTKIFNIQFEICANGITRVGLGTTDMKGAKFLVAPLSEQKVIANFIESASQKIDKAIDFQQQQIEKLKEYKSSLIDAAVTGKVKVS